MNTAGRKRIFELGGGIADVESRTKLRQISYGAAKEAGQPRFEVLRLMVIADIKNKLGRDPVSEEEVKCELRLHAGDELRERRKRLAEAFRHEYIPPMYWEAPIPGDLGFKGTSETLDQLCDGFVQMKEIIAS